MIEQDGTTIRIYTAKWKAWLWVGIFGAASALVVMAYQSGYRGIGVWIGLGLGPLVTLAMLFTTFFSKPILEINESGLVLFNGLFSGPMKIEWNEIEDIREVEVRHNRLMGIALKPECKAGHGTLARFTYQSLGVHLGVPLLTLPGKGAQLLELVRGKWELGRK